jgi:benzoyl-CoA reductase subunit C
MFVTHPICDAARNLAGVWARNFRYPAQILYLPQNATSAAAPRYLHAEYARLLRDIEQVAGRPVTPDALRRSIAVFDENRRLVRALWRLKRDEPWKLAVDEAYVLLAVGTVIPRELHTRLLADVLPRLAARAARRQDKIRVVLEGGFCEQPPLDLLTAIAQSCYVVDDDLLIGQRWLTRDVGAEHTSPLAALADAYLERSTYSPVQHDARKPKEHMLLARIREADAQAAIIAAAKMCEPGLDEQVAYAKALDEAHIPYFVTEFEEKMSGFDQLQLQLETFVESILFD